jgi:DNA adenine methylase
LQACSFNGLWRVNKAGQYNVPWGRPASFDFDAMHLAAALLRDCRPQIVESDFAALLSDEHRWIGKNNIIYADPPYLGEHSAYSPGGFDTIHHKCLAHWLSVAARAGAACWASGSDCDLTRQIYGTSGVRFHSIPVSRSISCKGSTRGTKTELLIQFPVAEK